MGKGVMFNILTRTNKFRFPVNSKALHRQICTGTSFMWWHQNPKDLMLTPGSLLQIPDVSNQEVSTSASRALQTIQSPSLTCPSRLITQHTQGAWQTPVRQLHLPAKLLRKDSVDTWTGRQPTGDLSLRPNPPPQHPTAIHRAVR